MRAFVISATAAALALAGVGLAAASQAHGSPLQATAALIRSAAASPAASPAAADRAAAAYVQAHYPGAGTTRVLATEPDTDRGVAVYDVRIAAPDAVIYVVHVQRSNDAVLWASKAENQGTAQAGAARTGTAGSTTGSAGTSPDSRDAPDHSPASAPRSPDHQDQPDTASSQLDH